MTRKPEILAPAGDDASLRAAVAGGADAVYFGLKSFSARARATNFDLDALTETLRYLHEHGRKGYVALNTLVFDDELPALEAAVRACAEAGADAIIVQDLGVARIAHAIAPTLPIHASTQMTCTDAGAAEFARELGASRVILARELSLDDIAQIRAGTSVELEVFVHGALCIAYSGQCLTSEAIGGRSANRGACAQACRLPYDLVVDGTHRPLGDVAYLLSPQDLEASDLVARLTEIGVASIKIEGRLKGPEYVFATSRLYRDAVDGCTRDEDKAIALQTFSRGSGHGFLDGTNHQVLVDGETCDHRGVLAATARGVRAVTGRTMLLLETAIPLTLGDGLLVQGGYAGAGELGGRIWAMRDSDGGEIEKAEAGCRIAVWFGPDRPIADSFECAGKRVFRTNAPRITRALGGAIERERTPIALDVVLSGNIGEPMLAVAHAADGRTASASSDVPLAAAKDAPLSREALEDKLGSLGETPFTLRTLDTTKLPANVILPHSSLKRTRRALVAELARAGERRHAVTATDAMSVVAHSPAPDRAPPPEGLFVLCRNREQAEAAIVAGARGVYLDFLELQGVGTALRALRDKAAWVGVAPPRIRKPGEEKIDRYLRDLAPDALLVRGLGALREGAGSVPTIGDFSLNVTNRVTAAEVMRRGLIAFTPSFDLDEAQLQALVKTPFGPFAEVVVHHPMPLFHMEHCVFAATLSDGADYRTCGRPCDRHTLALRDRAGVEHPVVADVGCRNTVFHGRPQSAINLLPGLRDAGVRRFRIELVRETAADVAELVGVYAAVLRGERTARDAWHNALPGYGVVRGSLRVID